MLQKAKRRSLSSGVAILIDGYFFRKSLNLIKLGILSPDLKGMGRVSHAQGQLIDPTLKNKASL